MTPLLLLALAAAPAGDVKDYADKQVRQAARRLGDPKLGAFLHERIALDLEAKRASGFELDDEAVRRTVVDYEIFRLRTFVRSGVFAKKYFGYFDERWDTAKYEVDMRKTIRGAVDEANAFLKERKATFAVTDIEIAVTFIAEGGAILLREKQSEIERIHPVHGVGLDDIAPGFKEYGPLVARLDRRLGTGLGNIVDRSVLGDRLKRHMTFREAIAGTVIMYVYEKAIAARKLANAGRGVLKDYDLDDQFIISSLVYNSGILFSKERIKMIRTFSTASYLAGVSKQNEKKRWALPVFNPRAGAQFVLQESMFPEQPTSWSAVYHILQRYGGFVAMRKFTDVFDANGQYRLGRKPAQ